MTIDDLIFLDHNDHRYVWNRSHEMAPVYKISFIKFSQLDEGESL